MPFICSCGLECLTDEEARAEDAKESERREKEVIARLMKYVAPKTCPKRPMAESVLFDDETFTVCLKDGRRIVLPLSWSPMLAQATPEQRQNYRFVGRGVGIHWPDIDEDLSVRRLLVADGEPY